MLLIKRTLWKRLFVVACQIQLVLFGLLGVNVFANSPSQTGANILTITPTRCVALRQGQTCYLEAEITWKTSKKGNYCLINLTTGGIGKCWQNQSSGKLLLDFEGISSNDFALREESQSTDLANGQIMVAWVFSSSKRNKSNWKLF